MANSEVLTGDGQLTNHALIISESNQTSIKTDKIWDRLNRNVSYAN